MFRANIKNIAGEITHQGPITSTAQQAMQWATSQPFKLSPRRIRRVVALKMGLSLAGLEPEFEMIAGQEVVFYTFPPEQTAEIVDVSLAVQDSLEEQESAEAIILCADLKAKIRALNKRKLKSGDWDNAKFLAFVSSPIIAQAERALGQASLGSYKAVAVQATDFYTAGEIANILIQVDAHITKWVAKGVL